MSVLLLASVFLSLIINTFNLGFFSFASFGILISLYFLLFYIFYKFFVIQKTDPVKNQKNIILSASLLLIITYSLFLYSSGGIYQESAIPSLILMVLPVLLFPIILTFLMPKSYEVGNSLKSTFFVLLGSILLIRFLMIWASPHPIIDVYTQLLEGPLSLLKGVNPYSAIFSQVYTGVVSDYYNYWPVTLLLELPFVALFHDPRILLILADFGSALLLIGIGRRKPVAYLLSLVYLVRPNSNFVIEQSFLSSLESFFFFLSFYILSNKKKIRNYNFFLGLTAGLLAGIKQIYITIILFFLALSTDVKKLITGFITVFLVCIMPFIMWNPSAFYADTIDFFFHIYEGKPNIPIHQSLNVNSFLFPFIRTNMPFAASLFFILIFLLILLQRLNIYMKNKIIWEKYKEEIILLGIILFYITFYLFLSHAFINYYFVISGLVILLSVKVLTSESDRNL